MGNNCCSQNLNEIYELSTGQWDIENRRMKYIKTKNAIWKKKQTLKAKCKIDIDMEIPDNLIGVKSSLYLKNQKPYSTNTSSLFVDPLFKPEENSIIYVNKDKEAASDILPEEIEQISGLVWKRPDEIYKGGYTLYSGIDVDDIKQGIIGNCYFLSSISAIAEFDYRIKNIIVENDVTKNGQYQIRLYLNGVPKLVVVDDYLPCIMHKNKPKLAFTNCHGNDNEIWVSLIEKAWAKVNQSYAMTIAGLPSEGLSSMTEAPTVTYIHKKFSEEKMWEILLRADVSDHIICTCTRGIEGLDGTNSEEMGLVPGHAYTIISAHDITSRNLKLLKIRNPWGQFEWKGDYSDRSRLWDYELKNLIHYKNVDDGTFYMTFKDFLNFFPYSFICKYEKGYHYDYKEYTQYPDESIVISKIVLNNPTNIMINLHQKSPRYFNDIKNYHLNMSRVILCRYDKNKVRKYTYIKSHASKNEKLHLELKDLPKGEYHILSHVNWPFENDKNSYVISVYANNKTYLQDLSSKEIPEDFMHCILYSYLEQHENKTELKPDLHLQASYVDNDLGFYMLLFKNSSKNSLYSINFEALLNRNTRLATSHPKNKILNKEGENTLYEMSFDLEPETDYLVLYELLDEPWYSKLKIGKMSVCGIKSCRVDANRAAILNNVKKLSKYPLDLANLYYSELESDTEIFIIFLNENDVSLKLQVILKDSTNLKYDQTRHILHIESNNMNYIKLNKDNIQMPVDFNFDYSVKKNFI